ncbi:sarcosine oxidase subunit gamma [Litorivicinus lipolyticus]|uniref:Sarcosine oxidase subunit gamma n=1 Tax=Litorivicinus lipolyticus TaxID=418701 RepID=A0A5Q2QDK2_9GAMM|nr:sarcosine oxidase subunit gamma [Litorivicinus lipolyticus]QGG80441.1 sarcosine oxidase subunit gamma [Litorivicinus lipolyticus]
MDKLTAISALGASAALDKTIGAVHLTECSNALLSCATRRGQQGALDHALPGLPEVGRFADLTTLEAFWTGPQQWMLELPYDGEGDQAGAMAARLRGAASVTEQTDAWVRFDVRAPDLAVLFERLAMVDWRHFTVGCAQRGALEHLGCLFVRRATDSLSVYGPRSSAASLLHAIEQAAERIR